jgi:hypothetical protein
MSKKLLFVVMIVFCIVMGILASMWLIKAPPREVPPHPSYLPD